MKNQSFASLVYENKKKKTRREQFLEEMNQVIPWAELIPLIEKHYPKEGNGRQPMPMERMLRIYFMQQWYGLSDPAMEDALYDMESMRRFAGIDLTADAVPDETTILNFRHLLEKYHLTQQLFEKTNQYLKDKGLLLREGTIVDATIINAPSSTKNREQKRDPEMHSTRKSNQYYFGMKAHVGTDTRGIVHTLEVSHAGVHDSQVFDELVHGEEKEIYGDKGYSNSTKQQEYEKKGIKWSVNSRGCRFRQLTEGENERNHQNNHTRAFVEHPFGVIKHLWHYQKTKYKGLYKNAVQLFSLFTLANLYRLRHELINLEV
jgi:transposase, IS5 family